MIALTACMNSPLLIDVKELVVFAKQAAEDGDIDPTTFMSGHRVFLISGTKDTTLKQGLL